MYSLEFLMMDGKTCRVIFNKLENCASSWFYYGHYFILFSTAAGMPFPGIKIVIVECSSILIAPQNVLYLKAKPRTYDLTSFLAAEVVCVFLI
jgi:hypothetical protein